MTNHPLVSVVTPTFNHERYIRECLDGVIAQSYRNWEHIVIDDGSTDRTKRIIQEYSDPRLHCIWSAHRGVFSLSDIYNEALGHANGKYIAILEGDDSWPPLKLEHQLSILERSGALLSWGRGVLIDGSGVKIGYVGFNQRRALQSYFKSTDLLPRLLVDNIVVPSSGVVLRKEMLNRIGGFQGIPGVPYIDLPTWLKIARTMGPSERFNYVPEHVVNYRVHRDQVSRNYRDVVSATERVSRFFLEDITPAEISGLGLSRDALRRMATFHRAREAIARKDWGLASELLRTSWREERRFGRLWLIQSYFSALAHVDLPRYGFEIKRCFPGFSDAYQSIFRLWTAQHRLGLKPTAGNPALIGHQWTPALNTSRIMTQEGHVPGGRDRATRLGREEVTSEDRSLQVMCPSCSAESQAKGTIPGWGEWRICSKCTLEFANPHRLNRSAMSLFQDAYLGKEGSAGMHEFAARLKIRQALKTAPRLWFWTPAFDEIFEWLNRRVRPGGCVLEIGSGMGFVLLALKDAGFQPVGIDVAEVAVRVNEQDGIRVWHGTVETVPQSWVEPKAILALFMLHHVEDPASFLKTIRHKWPDAPLILAQYGPSNINRVSSRPPRTLTIWNAQSLKVGLTEAGYIVRVEEFSSTGAENPLLVSFRRVLSRIDISTKAYILAKRVEKSLILGLFGPFRRDRYVLLAFAAPLPNSNETSGRDLAEIHTWTSP